MIPKPDDIYTDPKFLEGFPAECISENNTENETEAMWIQRAVMGCTSPLFFFAELGAGYGRWSVFAAATARELRPEIHTEIIAVEAEPTHYEWLLEHLHSNGITPFRVFNHPLAGRRSFCLFQVGEPSEWYGQSIVFPCRWLLTQLLGGKRVKIARTITLDDVFAEVSTVDMVDMDVQGQELKILSGASPSTLDKIKLLYIGTHSPWIEVGLRKLFYGKGWVKEEDIPQDPKNGIVDGVQVWRNPKWG